MGTIRTSFLTPGPSELYYTLPDHLKTALRDNVMAISHRSKAFQDIMQHTQTQLRELLQVPDNFYIVFTGSATEIWERSLQSLVANKSFHLVNGSFSAKYYQFAQQQGLQAEAMKAAPGLGFSAENVHITPDTELICLTHNETSTGVSLPLADIAQLRSHYPAQLIAVDAVSSLPYPKFNFEHLDMLFFSVQKCFGLPAGLGVWMLNERCLEKSLQLQQQGKYTGGYHSIQNLVENIRKNETPETPNMLGIYLLGKVAEDMNRRGINNIRTEMNYKAALMYHSLQQHEDFELFVKEEAHRSSTVIVAEVKREGGAKPFINFCKEHGIVLGSGYGSFKESHIRIANFPTHSKEVFEQLADLIGAF